MAQEKYIELVNVTKQKSNEINSVFKVKTNFNSEGEIDNKQQIYKSEISQIVQNENSVETLEGELLLLSEENIRYNVDINGDFIIEDIVSDRYTINNNGELEYTY